MQSENWMLLVLCSVFGLGMLYTTVLYVFHPSLWVAALLLLIHGLFMLGVSRFFMGTIYKLIRRQGIAEAARLCYDKADELLRQVSLENQHTLRNAVKNELLDWQQGLKEDIAEFNHTERV